MEARHFYAIGGALAEFYKNPQKFPHSSPIFYSGVAKTAKFWPKFRYHSCSELGYFELEKLYRKSKKSLSRVDPPNSEKRWRKGGSKIAAKG